MAFIKTTGDKSPHSKSSGTWFENEIALLSLIQVFFDCFGIYQIIKEYNKEAIKCNISHERTSADKKPSISSYGCKKATTLLFELEKSVSRISTSASTFKCWRTESVILDGSTNKWTSPLILTSNHEKNTGLYWISDPRKFSNPLKEWSKMYLFFWTTFLYFIFFTYMQYRPGQSTAT